jgi:hypothetical protein
MWIVTWLLFQFLKAVFNRVSRFSSGFQKAA